MEKKNIVPLCMAIACLLCMAFFGAASLLAEDRSDSDAENRELQRWPKWSAEKALSGEYFETVDTYFSDQLYARDSIFAGYAQVQRAVGLARIGDVLIGKGEDLLPYYKYRYEDEDVLREKQAKIERNYGIIEGLRDAVESYGGTFLYVEMPAKRVMHTGSYPAFYQNYAATTPREFEIFEAAMVERGIDVLDLRAVFAAQAGECYFQTDHHINSVGAQAAYDAIIDLLAARDGRIEKYAFTWEDADKPLLGSYNRQIAGIIETDDRIRVATPEGGYMPYTRRDLRGGEWQAVEGFVNLDNKGKDTLRYNAYMDGDQALTVIETNRPALPTVMMSGDSYTNIIEPLLLCSFDAAQYIDTRFWEKGESLEEYILEQQPDVYIMMYTAPLANLYIDRELRADPPR